MEKSKENLYYLEGLGKSEAEIAAEFGMTRQGLLKLRKRTGWLKKRGRSDKGKKRDFRRS